MRIMADLCTVFANGVERVRCIMGRKRSKSDRQKDHFLRRVKQRFGLYLTEHDYHVMIQLIQSGNTVLIEKQSNRITKHELIYKGETIHVCYDTVRKNLVTALEPEGHPLYTLYNI
jgi:hypothetical protein